MVAYDVICMYHMHGMYAAYGVRCVLQDVLYVRYQPVAKKKGTLSSSLSSAIQNHSPFLGKITLPFYTEKSALISLHNRAESGMHEYL